MLHYVYQRNLSSPSNVNRSVSLTPSRHHPPSLVPHNHHHHRRRLRVSTRADQTARARLEIETSSGEAHRCCSHGPEPRGGHVVPATPSWPLPVSSAHTLRPCTTGTSARGSCTARCCASGSCSCTGSIPWQAPVGFDCRPCLRICRVLFSVFLLKYGLVLTASGGNNRREEVFIG